MAAVTATSRLPNNPNCVTPRRMTGTFPDIVLVIPGSFTFSRELNTAATRRSANWCQAGMCQFMTPNDSGHKLATATIPIMTLALIGREFVMGSPINGFSRVLVFSVVAIAEGRHWLRGDRGGAPDYAEAHIGCCAPYHARAAPNN